MSILFSETEDIKEEKVFKPSASYICSNIDSKIIEKTSKRINEMDKSGRYSSETIRRIRTVFGSYVGLIESLYIVIDKDTEHELEDELGEVVSVLNGYGLPIKIEDTYDEVAVIDKAAASINFILKKQVDGFFSPLKTTYDKWEVRDGEKIKKKYPDDEFKLNITGYSGITISDIIKIEAINRLYILGKISTDEYIKLLNGNEELTKRFGLPTTLSFQTLVNMYIKTSSYSLDIKPLTSNNRPVIGEISKEFDFDLRKPVVTVYDDPLDYKGFGKCTLADMMNLEINKSLGNKETVNYPITFDGIVDVLVRDVVKRLEQSENNLLPQKQQLMK